VHGTATYLCDKTNKLEPIIPLREPRLI